MPDDKGLGKRILGLFVELEPAPSKRDEAPPAGDESPADELARLARQTSEATRPAPALPVTQPAGAPSPGPLPLPTEPVAPAKIDFDAVFKNAGLDPQAIDRVRKAEALLQTLPDGASDELKLQIVQASLKAFGFEVSKIVEAVDTQLQALETYVRVNEQQTAKAVTDAQAQIAKLDDQIITLKADIDKRTTALAALASAAEVRRQQVSKVADFFHAPAPSGSGDASGTKG
ncbi:MAG: hypothetical protein MUC96_25330 [Myxococcaceae bacterium]|jgi:hypothetical protein|nr:hypothetical protein [Myxococcaceae bacterium]